MKTADFDFDLPYDLIALRPPEKRDNARLLILHRNGCSEHRKFSDIVEYLNEGDLILLNDTKVFPSRIIATKPAGGKLDIQLVRETDNNGTWEIMLKGRFSGIVDITDGIKAEIWTGEVKSQESGVRSRESKKFLRFLNIEPAKVNDMLWQYGHMPLPPYIKRMPDNTDKLRYQTVFARHQGSIAAPTAGLHFTDDLLRKINDKGIFVERLTLHVGIGTFKPVKTVSIEEHSMDSEYFEISSSLINRIQGVRKSGGRLIAVGTTTTRAIEAVISGQWTASGRSGQDGCLKGYTNIFIYPGYTFNVVDSLITNFHLPRSTPLMLASALCGFEKILKTYKEAVAMGYRFFSYGDAMLIL